MHHGKNRHLKRGSVHVQDLIVLRPRVAVTFVWGGGGDIGIQTDQKRTISSEMVSREGNDAILDEKIMHRKSYESPLKLFLDFTILDYFKSCTSASRPTNRS